MVTWSNQSSGVIRIFFPHFFLMNMQSLTPRLQNTLIELEQSLNSSHGEMAWWREGKEGWFLREVGGKAPQTAEQVIHLVIQFEWKWVPSVTPCDFYLCTSFTLKCQLHHHIQEEEATCCIFVDVLYVLLFNLGNKMFWLASFTTTILPMPSTNTKYLMSYLLNHTVTEETFILWRTQKTICRLNINGVHLKISLNYKLFWSPNYMQSRGNEIKHKNGTSLKYPGVLWVQVEVTETSFGPDTDIICIWKPLEKYKLNWNAMFGTSHNSIFYS